MINAAHRRIRPPLPAVGATAALLTIQPLATTDAGEPPELPPIRVESTTIDDRFAGDETNPTATSVVRGDEVDAAAAEHIEQVLRRIPGLTADTRTGSDDAVKIKLRGVEGQRYMGEDPGVAIIIDGVPVKEDTGRVNIDMDNIESIRVIRGSASYLYGEDALAGAVVITTKRGADMAGFRTEGALGSHGTQRWLGRAGYADERFNAYLQASRRESDGWHARAGYEADYLNGKLQYYLDDYSDITFNFEHTDRFRDETGTVRGRSQAERDPRNREAQRGSYTRNFHLDLARYSVTYMRDLRAAGELTLSGYRFTDETWNWYAPMRYDGDGNAVNDADLYESRSDKEQVQRGLKAEWRNDGQRFAGLLGLDLRENTYEQENHYINDNKPSPSPFAPVREAGTRSADHETDETIRAAYGELKWRLAPRWTLTGNARFDHTRLEHSDHMEGRSLDRSFNVWSWRAGSAFQASDRLTFFANASTGFRNPTVGQLFAGGFEDDTAGNPDLDPEEVINLELGLRARTRWLGQPVRAELTLFQMDRDDFILRQAGQYATTTGEQEARYENIGGARHRGLELALSGEAGQRVSWGAAYTLLDARFTDYDNFNLALGNARGEFLGECDQVTLDDPRSQYCVERHDNSGNRIPRVPRHTLNLLVDFHLTPAFTLTTESHTVSSWFADELNEFELSGHTVFNLVGNYRQRLGRVDLRAFLRVDNVFDQWHYERASAFYDNNQDGEYDWEDVTFLVNPGRTWTAGLEARF
ncbi:TonB-dependent receptor [Alkalilimnicola ehrlichii]|uniref:TonB-dependent receptor n=1 Tax=Alkalilimnicola ehrlichii TaxID=351052 RepID=UPI003BA11FF9